MQTKIIIIEEDDSRAATGIVLSDGCATKVLMVGSSSKDENEKNVTQWLSKKEPYILVSFSPKATETWNLLFGGLGLQVLDGQTMLWVFKTIYSGGEFFGTQRKLSSLEHNELVAFTQSMLKVFNDQAKILSSAREIQEKM